MKLAPFRSRREHQIRRLSVLRAYLDQAPERPCDRCDAPCPTCGSKTCTCSCSARCASAPRLLSSDANFEIEPQVVPLVYALNATGSFQCCWSCEGHEVAHKPSSLPRAWFYAADIIFAELLTDHIHSLSVRKKMSHAWTLELLGNMGAIDTPMFQLRPGEGEEHHDLEQCRADLRWLAADLPAELKQRASSQVQVLEREVWDGRS